MSLSLYRKSKLGETLTASLNELKNDNKISDFIYEKILETFDVVMCEEIPKRQKNKCNIKGSVKNYKHCDDIWIFHTSSVYLKTESENFHSEKMKVVACEQNMKNLHNDRNKKIYNKKYDENN